jgi:uncharacterized membrane protein YfcA
VNIPFDLSTFAIAAAVTFCAYVIFGVTAFGAALFTTSVLSHFFALEFVLPLCVLLDVLASLALGRRFSRDADLAELKWLAPFSLIGAVAGVALLVTLPRDATLTGFGVLLVVYAIYALREGESTATISRRWAPLSGFTGGAMGTLFGVGAPPYAIYLSRRFTDKAVLRATLSNMVLLSTSIRLLVFIVSGFMLWKCVVGFALLAPFMFSGLWLGNRVHGHVSRAQVSRLVSVLLMLIGVSLLVRAAA